MRCLTDGIYRLRTENNRKTASTDSPEGAQEESGASADLKEVNVVLDWYPNAVHAFIYDAIEKGYYAEEGIKVNVQFRPTQMTPCL